MRFIRAWVGAAAAAFLAGSAFAQGIDHSRFHRSTLDALSANLATAAAADKRAVPLKVGDKIDASLSPWVFEASYAGATRPIGGEDAAALRGSLKAAHQEPLAALYEQSMLFRVNGKDLWLPVEAAQVPYFAKELKAGDNVDLYVLLSGGVLEKAGWNWQFLVVDFLKRVDSPAGGKP